MPAQLQAQLELQGFDADALAVVSTPTSSSTSTSTSASAATTPTGGTFAGFSSSTSSAPLTNQILYGNGTMLSDIGEVTELESCAGVDQPQRTAKHYTDNQRDNNADDGDGYDDDDDDDDDNKTVNNDDNDVTITKTTTSRANPVATPTLAAIRTRARARAMMRQRSGSVGSDGSIATPTNDHQDRRHLYALDALDDLASLAGSNNCLGDDEGSVADHPDIDALRSSLKLQNREQDAERYSTATLSARAEAILANAKKRLTVRI